MDAGYAGLLKVFTKQAFFNWLDDDENANKWYGVDKFTASERRILITHWVGEGYRKLLNSTYDSYRWRLFQKTGCLLTADGSDDHLVQPEGLSDYSVPPPAEFDPSNSSPIPNELQPAEEDGEVDPDIEEEDDDCVMEVLDRGAEDDYCVMDVLDEDVFTLFPDLS